MRGRWWALPAAACAVVLAACDTSATRATKPLPAGPQVIRLEMLDYSFGYTPPTAAGRTVFRVANTGDVRHNLSLLPLPADLPPIDEQLRGTTRRAINPLAAIRSRGPGARTSFAVDLLPGTRYAFICFVSDEDGQAHWRRGMSSEFRTPDAPSTTEPVTG